MRSRPSHLPVVPMLTTKVWFLKVSYSSDVLPGYSQPGRQSATTQSAAT